MRVPIVVITGASLSGKTSVVERLKHHPNWSDVYFAPEAATVILANEFGKLGRGSKYSDPWKYGLQEAIFHYSHGLETAACDSVLATGMRGIVMDRSVLDGEAYYPGGGDQMMLAYGYNRQDILDSYEKIIFLESLAVRGKKEYDQLLLTNPERFHSWEETVEAQNKLLQTYSSGNMVYIPVQNNIAELEARVITELSKVFDNEFERKYSSVTTPDVFLLGEQIEIEQVYLVSLPGYEVRLRKEVRQHCASRYYQSVKSGTKGDRKEQNLPISSWVFDEAFGNKSLPRVIKKRWVINHGLFTVSCDEFDPSLGYSLIEVESRSPFDKQTGEEILKSVGVTEPYKEVTDDDKFYNRAIAIAQNNN